MINIPRPVRQTFSSRCGQILLPAVMLAPIFILVVYLLFETSKLSMTKVRQQFALDNGAYSQMSTTSGYLNSVAMVNGPLPYRVMQTFTFQLPKKEAGGENLGDMTVFDIFYKAGAFPAAGPNYELGPKGAISNPSPTPESTDWKFKYYKDTRKNWEKEDPTEATNPDEENTYLITDKEIADNYFFSATTIGLQNIKEYFTIFLRTGSIYASQNYVYEDTIKNSRMFRESYFLNSRDCSRTECGKQAAATLDRYQLETKPFEISKPMRFYVTADYAGSTSHSGAYNLDIKPEADINTKVFQFAYLTPGSRNRLRQLAKGVVLKQKFVVPENRFNINITQRYHPYVRNTVTVSCPRNGNNCVWPNPLPKYSVKVGP